MHTPFQAIDVSDRRAHKGGGYAVRLDPAAPRKEIGRPRGDVKRHAAERASSKELLP